MRAEYGYGIGKGNCAGEKGASNKASNCYLQGALAVVRSSCSEVVQALQVNVGVTMGRYWFTKSATARHFLYSGGELLWGC